MILCLTVTFVIIAVGVIAGVVAIANMAENINE